MYNLPIHPMKQSLDYDVQIMFCNFWTSFWIIFHTSGSVHMTFFVLSTFPIHEMNYDYYFAEGIAYLI